MKKISILLSCLFLVILSHAQKTEQKEETASQPQIENKTDITQVIMFNEDNHDFGQIPNGKPVEFEVVMKNISKDSLKIDNVKVGCGCTTPKYDQSKTYGPGEVFKVVLGFNGYANGPFEKSADINFSNGLSKHIRFHGVGYKVPDNPAPVNSAVEKLKSAG